MKLNSKKQVLMVLTCLVTVLVLASAAHAARAQSDSGNWLAFSENAAQNAPGITLTAADENAIMLRGTFSGVYFAQSVINGTPYLVFSGEGYETAGEAGLPALPVVHQLVEIPLGAQYTLEVTAKTSQTISLASLGVDLSVAPIQPSQPKCGEPLAAAEPNQTVYGSNVLYPESAVRVAKEFTMRGHRLLLLEFWPVQYNPLTAELETASELELVIHLAGSDSELTRTEADRLNSAAFNQILAPQVLNYNQNQPLIQPLTGEKYLIITADVYESALAPFVALKQSQGFDVSLVNLSTTGSQNTQIKSYISTQYQGPTPPDYVLLVGDYNDGSDSLTNWPFRTSGESSYRTDLEYFTMDGSNDFVPDMLYGRFPVREVAQVGNIIAKLQAYEAANGSEAWVKKAEFLASNDSNYYDVAEATHNYVINTYTLPKGYTGIFPNNPQAGGDKIYAITYGGTGANAVASMNDDRAFIVYSGHGASTFWDAPRVNQTDIRNMTGVAIPYVASHACVTADFNTAESFGDTWVIEPVNGGITFLGASDNSYWDEDDLLERTTFNYLYQDPAMANVPSVGSMRQAGLLAVDYSGSSLGNYYWEEYHIFGDPSLKIVLKPKYPDFGLSLSPVSAKVCNTGSAQTAVSVTSQNNFASPVSLSASGMTGFSTSFNPPSPVTPPTATTLTLTGNGSAPLGAQSITVAGVSGSLSHSVSFELSVFPALTAGPVLVSPANGALNISPKPTFSWNAIAQAEAYQLEVASDALFSQVLISQTGLTATSFTPITELPTDTQLYWRVTAVNICGSQVSAQVFTFKTRTGPGDCPAGQTKSILYQDDFEAGLGPWTALPDASTGLKWNLSTVRALSPQTSVLAAAPAQISDLRLVSPALSIPETDAPVSLIFWHRWTFDSSSTCKDAGVLEYSQNGGTSWALLPSTMLLTTPYNGRVATGFYNPLAGKTAWCFASDWARTVVDLESLKGKTVQFRFRMGSGNEGAAEGWYVDDVSLQTCVDPGAANYIYLPVVAR